MATRKKKGTQNGDKPCQDPLRLSWGLAELPSSQHRAGLAGLALAVRHLERLGTNSGICTIEEMTAHALTLRIDERGLGALFDLIYAASVEESEEAKPRKDAKTNEIIPPIRVDERKELNAKQKETTKKVYIYPRVVPRGEVVLATDPTRAGDNGAWTKLWREFIWTIMRGVPAQREPFESRAAKEPPSEGTDPKYVLTLLRDTLESPVKLPSTYFLGAQERTADDVPIQDRARFQFLLHFWPLAATVYVPQLEDRDGKRTFYGYATAVPDVADVAGFVDELPSILSNRSTDIIGYRPKGAIVALPAEGALIVMDMLRDRLEALEGARAVHDLVLGVDVFHSDKQGNSIRLLSSTRIEPDIELGDEYARIRNALWDLSFRRQRIVNLLLERPWFRAFDEIFAKLPIERFFGPKCTFAHDARFEFELRSKPFHGEPMNDEKQPTLEAILLKIVTNYLGRKLKTRRDLEWSTAKEDAGSRKVYEEEKERLARGAFLAIRGRTDQDFIDFFAGTLCSVPHHLSGDEFGIISRALRERTAEVRTLTLLALSARG